MLFLVDYENVGNGGMKGCDYLNEQDYLIVFYSDAKKHMEQRMLENITDSGCTFEICKLCKAGKNALDFYIASKLGELVGAGYAGIIAIISNDGGFQAVRDYWEKRASNKRKVLLSSCIEDGIVNGNENTERARELGRLRKKFSIGEYYAAYAERMRIRKALRNLFEGTEYENRIDEIYGMIEGKEKGQRLFILTFCICLGEKVGWKFIIGLKTVMSCK